MVLMDDQPQNEVENSLLLEKMLQKGGRLSIVRKLCFAVGGIPYQMTHTIINFFINIFLLEVAQIRPVYVSVVILSGKVWDGITDPMCGYLVNRTRTRFGQFRPWIIFAAPFACIAYFFLFFVPEGFDAEMKLIWYLLTYCSFQALLTCVHVPYTSLTMHLTTSQKERDSLTAYRMVAEACGVLGGVVVQGQLVKNTEVDCESGPTDPSDIEEQKWAYMLGSLITCAIYLVCCLVTFLGTTEIHDAMDRPDSFFRGFRKVITFRPYVFLVCTFLCMSLAAAVIQGNLALYVVHTLKLGNKFVGFILVLLVTAIACMPLWQKVLSKIGKKSASVAGMLISMPLMISFAYLPEGKPEYVYPVMVLFGVGVSVALLLPWSMLPDVIDDFMLKEGRRDDAIFYSFFVFFNKLSVGLALGLTQVALEFGGYVTGECEQSEEVALTLRYLLCPGPVIFMLLAMISVWMYPIDEKKRRYNKRRVEELEEECLAAQTQNMVVDRPPGYEQSDVREFASHSYRSLDDSNSGVERRTTM